MVNILPFLGAKVAGRRVHVWVPVAEDTVGGHGVVVAAPQRHLVPDGKELVENTFPEIWQWWFVGEE